MMCDIIYGSENAKFGQLEINLSNFFKLSNICNSKIFVALTYLTREWFVTRQGLLFCFVFLFPFLYHYLVFMSSCMNIYIYICMYVCMYVCATRMKCYHWATPEWKFSPFHEWNNWSNAIHLLLYDSSIGREYYVL